MGKVDMKHRRNRVRAQLNFTKKILSLKSHACYYRSSGRAFSIDHAFVNENFIQISFYTYSSFLPAVKMIEIPINHVGIYI